MTKNDFRRLVDCIVESMGAKKGEMSECQLYCVVRIYNTISIDQAIIDSAKKEAFVKTFNDVRSAILQKIEFKASQGLSLYSSKWDIHLSLTMGGECDEIITLFTE